MYSGLTGTQDENDEAQDDDENSVVAVVVNFVAVPIGCRIGPFRGRPDCHRCSPVVVDNGNGSVAAAHACIVVTIVVGN